MSDTRVAELEAELAEARAALAELERRVDQQGQDGSRVQALYDMLLDAVLSLDRSGTILGCNQRASEWFGQPPGVLEGQSVAELLEPESGAALVAVCKSDFEGAGESEVSLTDGTKVGFSISRIDAESVQLVLRDMTPMERIQDELLNTRRMASVGRLAGGIAHDINNPLAVIQGRVEMLRAVPDMPIQTRHRHLNVLEEHCRRVSRIVQNLHTFARPRNPDPRWLSFADVVGDVRENLDRRLERVVFDAELPPDLRIFADPDQLELVLVNLLSNAVDASPTGRVVCISAKGDEAGGVEVRVEDEGPGLSDDLLTGLRAPYAAGSASVEAGRGLSMSVNWGIVQEHGGWLTAENRVSRGASVAFYLPGPESAGDETGPGYAQGWSILVVDDDRVMCETIAWMLTTDGHRIVSVHSAEEAVQQIEGDSFDMIITDQRLPGMDGEGLIALIDERWPALSERTVLTSGLLYRPARAHHYLQKPFSRAQLLRLLAELSD